MKIIFVEPPGPFLPIRHGIYCPNQGILALAAYLEKYGYSVKILDPFLLKLTYRDILKKMEIEKPDVVCLSGYTCKAYYCMTIAELIKERFPSVTIVAGGMHFSALPEESLDVGKAIDYIVIGEGEDTLLELIRMLEGGRKKEDMRVVKGIAFKIGENFVKTTSRPFIEDLDMLPLPSYHLLFSDRRRKIPYAYSNTIGCVFSRGCIYKCRFCSAVFHWKGTYRRRSAVRVVEELEMLVKYYNKTYFAFNDDDFLMDSDRNIEFLDELEKRGLRIRYSIRTRVDSIVKNRFLLSRFKKLGLTSVCLGVESFCEEDLKRWEKNYKLDFFKLAVDILKKEKIPLIEICLIFGSPKDDKKSLDYMIEKMREYKLSIFFISFLTPLPKTAIFEDVKSKIKVWDYSKYDFMHAIVPTNYLSIREMETLVTKRLIFWWLNPLSIFSFIQNKYRFRFYLFRIFMYIRALLNIIKYVFSKRHRDIYYHKFTEIKKRHLKLLGQEEYDYKNGFLFGRRWGFMD